MAWRRFAGALDVVAATDQAVEVRNASIAVVDEDRSQLSARIADAFLPPHFKPPARLGVGDIDRSLDRGRYTFVVDIPPDFESDLRSGKRPELQVDIDATAIGQAFNGAGYIQAIVAEEVSRFLGRPANRSPPPVRRCV